MLSLPTKSCGCREFDYEAFLPLKKMIFHRVAAVRDVAGLPGSIPGDPPGTGSRFFLRGA